MTATSTDLTRILLPNGAQRVACGPQHARQLLFLAQAHDPAARLVTGPTSTLADVCAACGWCGVLTHRVPTCPLHDTCPDVDVLQTDHAGFAVVALLDRSALTTLPPRAWAYLQEAAGYLARAGTLTGPSLAAAVWSVRIDWLK